MNKWIKAALVRAIKTMAQAAAAMIGTGAAGIFDVDWLAVLSVSVLAGIMSMLTSVVGLPEVEVDMKKDPIPEGYFENLKEDGNGKGK